MTFTGLNSNQKKGYAKLRKERINRDRELRRIIERDKQEAREFMINKINGGG